MHDQLFGGKATKKLTLKHFLKKHYLTNNKKIIIKPSGWHLRFVRDCSAVFEGSERYTYLQAHQSWSHRTRALRKTLEILYWDQNLRKVKKRQSLINRLRLLVSLGLNSSLCDSVSYFVWQLVTFFCSSFIKMTVIVNLLKEQVAVGDNFIILDSVRKYAMREN